MATNIFNELANKFSTYEEDADVDIESIVSETALAFYDAFHSGQIYIDNLEEDLGIDVYPLSRLKEDAPEDRITNALYTYWYFALSAISEQNSDTLHILATDSDGQNNHISRWWYIWSPILHEEISRETDPEEFRERWLSITRCSIRACLFLAQNFKEKSPLVVDKKNQRLIFNNQIIPFPGSVYWDLFLLLYNKKGKPASHEEIMKVNERGRVNVLIGELKTYLKKIGGSEGAIIADAIENQRSVGYRLNLSKL